MNYLLNDINAIPLGPASRKEFNAPYITADIGHIILATSELNYIGNHYSPHAYFAANELISILAGADVRDIPFAHKNSVFYKRLIVPSTTETTETKLCQITILHI